MSEASANSLRSRFEERERAMKGHARTTTEIILGATNSSRADVMAESPRERAQGTSGGSRDRVFARIDEIVRAL